MTPEEYGYAVVRRITMTPQGRYDADVVEFETQSASADTLVAYIAEAIRTAIREALEEAEKLFPDETRLISLRTARTRVQALREEGVRGGMG